MPPSNENKPIYAKDEKALCFHGELLYEAKVLEVRKQDPKDKNSAYEYRVHYKGWKNTWDDWVPQDRLRKLTDDNKELAANLRRELTQQLQPKSAVKPATSKSRKQGSELGSGRGSEERHSSVPAGGRGTKRGRDNDIEKNKAIFPGLMKNSPTSSPSKAALASPPSSLWRRPSAVAASNKIASSSRQDLSSSSSSESPSDAETDFDADDEDSAKLPKTSQRTSSARPRGRPQTVRRRASDETPTKRGKKEAKVPTTRKWHDAFVWKGDKPQPPSLPRRNDPRVPKIESITLKDVSRQEDEIVESIDDILARPAPPDEPEYISFATSRRHLHMWAPLISGTTHEEKQKIEQERIGSGAVKASSDRYHPEYINARNDDPGNFNKLLFYESVPTNRKLAVCGVAKEPLFLDPPGSGSPFDALKFPDRLIAQLSRDTLHAETMYGWTISSLKKIPKEVMGRLDPKILAKMPDEVLMRLPVELLNKLPSHATFFTNLPSNSKFKRPEHRAKFLREQKGSISVAQRHSGTDIFRNGTATYAKPRDSAGKFLPRSFSAEGHPLKKQNTVQVFAGETRKNERPEDHTAPVLNDSCVTCATLGIECSGHKPQCVWCRKNKQRCSFLNEIASVGPSPSSWDFASEPQLTWPLQEGSQAYVLPFLQEDTFSTRPSIRITIPDHLKNLLVDDWEAVTKSLLLVPLPSQAPANFIIDTYYNEEKLHRRIGSAEADVLEEFAAGMKVYFEKSVGKILLYRFERSQLADVRKLWESGKYPHWEGKGPGDCYGAEHLTRMLVNMPELIAQTNMDSQSVARLKEEISKFCTWLARNSPKFFCAKYEKPSAEYIENAR